MLGGRSPRAGGLRKLATEHHADQLEARQRGGLTLADQAAVAQHGDAVGDFVDLVEEVADEDDADATSRELTHDAEENLDLMAVEAGGRLVQDQHARGEIDGARDRGDVLDGHRIVAKRRGDIDIETEICKQRLGAAAHLAIAHDAEAHRLAVEKQVLRHRQVRQQVDLLVDGGDAGPKRRLGRARRDLFTTDPDNAGISRKNAGDDLDQRGLAGAVLAEQRMDLAGAQREVDLLQGTHGAKALADPAHLKERRSRIGAVFHRNVTPAGVRL
ncbi:hypothetical protein ABIA43_005520 [Bradyrhizobium sp. USDA 328]